MSSTHDDADTYQASSERHSSPESVIHLPESEGSRALPLIDPSRISGYYQKGRYNDAYRELFNQQVEAAAARFEPEKNPNDPPIHVGTSSWSASEQAVFFAAIARLGRSDLPGIAAAVGTKSIPEIHEYLLALQDAAAKQGDTKLRLRDLPAAFEVSKACNRHLDLAGLGLARYQETFEAKQEHEKFGDYWLINPDLAEEFENTLDPERTIPASSGRGFTGSCQQCKQSKRKCDRNVPCGNCVKRSKLIDVTCVYKAPPIEPKRNSTPNDVDVDLLQAIPEAKLLRADIMLALSRNVFMNRSPNVPSPWAHWSKYTSEFASEPAIYRSAFNDLHALVVSVTKRLTHTAMVQATSRLRSHPSRNTKGDQLFVRQRDVLTAIDILGMKRNGRKRWISVARRCSLAVFVGNIRRSKKRVRPLSWDEVEQHLRGGPEPRFEPPESGVEMSLPLDQPGIPESDADSGSGNESDGIGPDADSEFDSMDATSDRTAVHEGPTSSAHTVFHTRDKSGRFLTDGRTLEEFDQKTSHREEQALWEMLRLAPTSRQSKSTSIVDEEEITRDEEKIITSADDWRAWTEYKAEWEISNPGAERLAAKEAAKKASRETARKSTRKDPKKAAESAATQVPNPDRGRGSNKHRDGPGIINDTELEADGNHVNAKLRERVSRSITQSQPINSSTSESESSVSNSDNSTSNSDNSGSNSKNLALDSKSAASDSESTDGETPNDTDDQSTEASDAESEMDWEE